MKEKAVIFLLVLLFAFISSTTAVPSSSNTHNYIYRIRILPRAARQNDVVLKSSARCREDSFPLRSLKLNSDEHTSNYQFQCPSSSSNYACLICCRVFYELFDELDSNIAIKAQVELEPSSIRFDKLMSYLQEKNRRMDIEVTDYSGTGANNHHDPRTPPGSF